MLKLAWEAGPHYLFGREERQNCDGDDTAPGQETKCRSEWAGPHPRRFRDPGGLGKSGPPLTVQCYAAGTFGVGVGANSRPRG